MDKTLIIGCKSSILDDYLKKFDPKIEKTLGIDIFKKDCVLKSNYLSIDYTDNACFTKINNFISNQNCMINKIVFAAGINYCNDFFSTSLDQWEKTFDVNITSFLFTLKSIYEFLDSKVSIVVIASSNGVVGHKNRIEYGPSKAALIQLVKNLTIDFSSLIDKDIRINAVSPFYVKTKKNKAYLESYYGEKLVKKIPNKKFITSDDVLNAIYFLLSDNSEAIRGQNIIIDNGFTIQ